MLMPRSEVLIPMGADEVGAEFLTYLWHCAQNGDEHVVDRKPVRIDVGQLMKVRSLNGGGAEVTVKGDLASSAPELFTALHRGARVVQAKIQLDINGVVVSGTLKADTLCLTLCRLPKDPQNDPGVRAEWGEKMGGEAPMDRTSLEDEARLLHRMSFLDDAQDVLDAWFDQFLNLRASKEWSAHDSSMRRWIAKNVESQSRSAPA
jgi:hypothetical protein